MKCSRCGCTDDRACPGGCFWVSKNPPICSNCFLPEPPINREQRYELTQMGRAAIDPEPA